MYEMKGYLCNPSKNTECEWSCQCCDPSDEHYLCFITTNADAAVMDKRGEPVTLTMRLTEQPKPKPKRGFWRTYWPTIAAATVASAICNWLLQSL